MDFQYIYGEYLQNGCIRIYGRASDKIKQYFDIRDFRPYCYILEDVDSSKIRYVVSEEGSYKDMKGNTFKRVYTGIPSDVPKLRSKSQLHGETDVLFVQRMMIDKGIYSGFSIPIRAFSNEYSIDEIKPSSFSHNPIYVVLDIETNYPDSDIITCVTLWDNRFKVYLTYALTPKKRKISKNWFEYRDQHKMAYYTSEEEMLRQLHGYLVLLKPDFIAGYNVNFDIDGIIERMQVNGVEWELHGFMRFDVLKFYRAYRGKSLGNKLKDVIVEEGFRKADELEATGYDPSMWYNFPESMSLVLYNYDDVLFCNYLIDKYGLVMKYWARKNRSGVNDINDTLHHSYPIDYMMLRLYNNYYVLPTRPKRIDDDESVDGAIVLQPKIGITRNIAVLDLSMFYTSTIILGNFSPEYEGIPFDKRIKLPLGKVPELCILWQNDRKKITKQQLVAQEKYGVESELYKQLSADSHATKVGLNAVYGHLLYSRSRVRSFELMTEMLELTRSILISIKTKAESWGYTILYGDSDSIFVQCPFNERTRILYIINEHLRQVAKERNFKPLWTVKLEYYADKGAFFRRKGENRAAKKKYIMRRIEIDGRPVDPPQLLLKGVSAIRGDQAKVSKNIQRLAFTALLDEKVEEFIDYIRKLVKKIKRGRVPIDDIAINMTLKKNPERYVSKIDYVRGSLYANKHLDHNIHGGTRIKMLYVNKIKGKPKTDVICYTNYQKLPELEVNYNKMIDRIIKMKIEIPLELTDFSWNDIKYTNKLKSFFK